MPSESNVELDNRTEDLLRSALDWQASTALPCDDLLAQLRQERLGWRPVPVRRRAMLFVPVGVAAAVVLGAVAIPLVLHGSGSGQTDPAANGHQGSAGVVSMPYHPTWVPAGLGQSYRVGTVQDNTNGAIDWTADGQDGVAAANANAYRVRFSISPDPSSFVLRDIESQPPSQRITINGAAGSIVLGNLWPGDKYGDAEVQWVTSDHIALFVTVRDMLDPGTIAKKVADSVVTGSYNTDVPLTVSDPLPGNYTGDGARTSSCRALRRPMSP